MITRKLPTISCLALIILSTPAHAYIGPGLGAGGFLVVLALAPTSAFAYIGPGAGLGAIVTFIAIALGMLLLVAGFLWYPLKRMLRKRRETEKKGSAEVTSENGNQ